MGAFIVFLPVLVISATAFSLSERNGVTAVAEFSNRLGLAIHKKISSDGNVFISPVSISVALGMLYYGTRGKTAEEIRSALGYQDSGLTDDEIHAAFKSLMETFSEESAAKEYILWLANAVMCQKDFPVLDEYKDGLLKNYKAVVRDVDFQNEAAEAVKEINDWVKLKTNYQIDKLLDQLDPSAVMVLLNAVYFKGTWKTQFDPKDTKEKLFYNKGLKSEQVKVPMMYLEEELPYVRGDNYRAVELPYKGEDISMVIVLPNEIDGLSELEQQLTPTTLTDLSSKARKREINLTLPKFKMEYKKEMTTVLQELGIKNVFQNSANLSGISKASQISVSEVLHKAVIEVNEEGSEASAITGIVVKLVSLDLDRHFYVDRPFFFAVIDKKTNLVLFQGSVNHL